MADFVQTAPTPNTLHAPTASPAPSRRDFLEMLTGAGVLIGLGALAWPLIDSMNPSADVLALSSTEVDLTPIALGSGITVMWRGKPVFVRHRTAEEIKTVGAVPISALIDQGSATDPADDQQRAKKPEWIVLIGICTHLGCIPLGNKPTDPRGTWGGWFCPCHGSQYDVSGRVRHGPAPLNLAVPDYAFLSDSKIKVG